MKQLYTLIQVLGPQKRYAALVITVMLVNTAVECFSISLLLPITQAVIYGAPEGRYAHLLSQMQSFFGIKLFLPFICLLFLIAVFIKATIGLLNHYLSKKLSLDLRISWMNLIFEKYMNSHISTIIRHKQGTLLHNLINETRRGSICIAQSAQYITRFFISIALLIMLFIMTPAVTLIISLIGSIAMLIMFSLKSYAKRVGLKRQELLQDITETASEGIGGIRQVKILSLESWISRYFSSKSRELFKVELRFETLRVIPAQLMELFIAGIIVSILLYIFFFTEIELKNILPMLALIGFTGIKILGNVAKLSSLHWQIIALLPAIKKVHQLISSDFHSDLKSSGENIEQISENIILKDISFRYNKKDKYVLQNISLSIPLKKLTVITGPSGSGKSTLADLIMGFYSPDTGAIVINKHPLSYWDMQSWRRKIGYVSQDIYLFHASIRENIAMGLTNCSEREIIAAAKQAHAHDFIQLLPSGYDTVVGDRGVSISGGQRQRIAIARILIRNPELLIFDEPTSALDPKAEQNILDLVKEISAEKTVIVISHRPAILKMADNILKIESH